jgi:hypothetical protein
MHIHDGHARREIAQRRLGSRINLAGPDRAHATWRSIKAVRMAFVGRVWAMMRSIASGCATHKRLVGQFEEFS